MLMNPIAYLILDDGSVWPGRSFGASPPRTDELAAGTVSFSGELIFNTGMTGYHEILTDPSYTGQLILMTYPHIGNYGDDKEWSEVGPEQDGKSSIQIKARGLVVRSVYDGPVPEGRQSLVDFLSENDICGISDIDTRALTLKLRSEGSRNGIIVRPNSESGIKDTEVTAAENYVKNLPTMVGQDLTAWVGTQKPEIFNEKGVPHVALLDCGVKMNIIRELVDRGCRVTVLPSISGKSDIMSIKPDVLLLSNGPGDPEPLEGMASVAASLMGKLPLWGICLGHQVLARAAGASTYKMSFGHHGVNHPVRDEKTGRVFVTSQNHGFAVDEKTLPEGFKVRFRNANDGSIEGLENIEMKLFCVQHHPEAAPGPIDSAWVFDSFLDTLKG
jgi:carbamoyl-phosphate synthase small subunit